MNSDMSFRVCVELWSDENAFDEFVEIMRKIGTIRQFAFFTHCYHTPPALEEMARRAAILKARMARLRSYGFSCGINNLCTLGHADEDRLGASQLEGRLFTDIEGRQSPGNFCPRDPYWRENYIIPVYRMLAEAETEFIWIDDDLRLNNHGQARIGCFCDDCLKAINRALELPQQLGRQEIASWLDAADCSLEERRARRLKLLKWNRSVLSNQLVCIEKTVHAVNPDIIIGKMDGIDGWEASRSEQAPLLQGPKNNPVWWRPGGGLYGDAALRPCIVQKMDFMGQICATLPSCVTSIQSEIESFPYRNLEKGTRTVCLETSAYCAAGCTGTALNVVGDPEWAPVSSYAERLAALGRQKSFNDRIVTMNDATPPTGIWAGIDGDFFLSNVGDSGKWADLGPDPSWKHGQEIIHIGLPRAYSQENAVCTMLNGATAFSLSDEKLKTALAGGVYMDAEALEVLVQRGFGDDLGFRTGRRFMRDAIERTMPHPLNGNGFKRNMRQSFWGGVATELIPAADGAVTLSRLVDYHENELAACVGGIYENARGGRIAVSGYAPWTFLGYVTKYAQMHRLFRWLSRDSMPAEVLTETVWSTVFARRRSDGNLAVGAFNLSMDDCPDFTLRLQTSKEWVSLVRADDEPNADCVIPTVPDPESPAMRIVKFPLSSFELVYLKTE